MMGSFNVRSSYVPQGGGQSSRVNVAPAVNSSDSGDNAASTNRNVQNGAATQPPLHGMLDDFYLHVRKESSF